MTTGETENLSVLPSSLSDKRSRKSDPPRVAKAVKTVTKPMAIAQGTMLNTRRVSRDQAQGMKERDNKKKIWSR